VLFFPLGVLQHTLTKGVVWFVTVHPATIFSCKSVTAMIVPVLARKPRPHILITNRSSFAEMAVIMRILAEQWRMQGTGAGLAHGPRRNSLRPAWHGRLTFWHRRLTAWHGRPTAWHQLLTIREHF